MRIFKGNRFTTPRFNYPVFKFERSRKIVVGRNKLTVPWYRPYSYAFTLFEHTVMGRIGQPSITFRGFYHDGVAYPMTATLKYNSADPVMYVLDWELPPYFNNDYVFMNPFSIHEQDPKVFQFEPKFDAWFKEQLWDFGLVRSEEEKRLEPLITETAKQLVGLEVEQELMGVTLFEDTRVQWFGKLTMPLWAAPEDVNSHLNEIRGELKRQEQLCA